MSRLVPVLGRLLAAGSPTVIKTIRAGLMVANSPYCITSPDGKQLSTLFHRPETDPSSEMTPPLSETTPSQKALSKEALALKDLAESTREKAIELLESDGWRKIDSVDGDELFIKWTDGRSVWKFRTVIKCCSEKFANELIHNCENCPSWNKAVKLCQTHSIADGVEILHQQTGTLFGGLVSPREFVNVRHRGRLGQVHYSAVTSIDHSDFPRPSNYVRGLNFPTIFTVRPCADSPDRCVVEGTLNYDLKLRLVPVQLIEYGMHAVWRQLRREMLQLAERVRR